MCIVIDTCTFDTVFSAKAQKHSEFAPVCEWILNGKGKLVFGGTTYRNELFQSSNRMGIVKELKNMNKVIQIEDSIVNQKESEIREMITDKDFDDPHIIALISESTARLVCSDDKRAHIFFKKKTLYRNQKIPHIYSSKKHERLLCDRNIPRKYL